MYSYLRNDGALVMGRGIAQTISRKFPEIQEKAGSVISSTCGHMGDYGLLFVDLTRDDKRFRIGLFQVKHHFKDSAEYKLIKKSCYDLISYISKEPCTRFHLNYPGIGYGKLSVN